MKRAFLIVTAFTLLVFGMNSASAQAPVYVDTYGPQNNNVITVEQASYGCVVEHQQGEVWTVPYAKIRIKNSGQGTCSVRACMTTGPAPNQGTCSAPWSFGLSWSSVQHAQWRDCLWVTYNVITAVSNPPPGQPYSYYHRHTVPC